MQSSCLAVQCSSVIELAWLLTVAAVPTLSARQRTAVWHLCSDAAQDVIQTFPSLVTRSGGGW